MCEWCSAVPMYLRDGEQLNNQNVRCLWVTTFCSFKRLRTTLKHCFRGSRGFSWHSCSSGPSSKSGSTGGMALGIAAVAAIVWATKPSGGGVVGGLSFVVVACFVANCVDRARLCPGHHGQRQMPHSHRAHGLRISGNGSADHWPVPARG